MQKFTDYQTLTKGQIVQLIYSFTGKQKKTQTDKKGQ